MTMIELAREAKERIRGVIRPTPLVHSTSLSSIYGTGVRLKLENLQKTGSFKVRGAYNKIASLTKEEKARGVIAASTGNHAQAVAWAATFLNVSSVVVMPENVPIVKHVARFSALVRDRPGTLSRLASVIAETGGNILHIVHRRDAVDIPLGMTRLEMVLEVEGPEHAERVLKRLRESGYAIEKA